MQRFKKRHPNVSKRIPQKVNKAAMTFTAQKHAQWLEALLAFIDDRNENPNAQGLLLDPRRIFNADETGFAFMGVTGRLGAVLAERGSKYVCQETHGTKEQFTVMYCGNAESTMLPPFIVVPATSPKNENKEPPVGWIDIDKWPEAQAWATSRGWMTSAAFIQFLHFMDQCISTLPEFADVQRPILLVMDGHGSHISGPAARFAKTKNIILWLLPANATAVSKKKFFFFIS